MNYLVQVGIEPTRNNNKVIRIYTCRYARLAYDLKSERERGHTPTCVASHDSAKLLHCYFRPTDCGRRLPLRKLDLYICVIILFTHTIQRKKISLNSLNSLNYLNSRNSLNYLNYLNFPKLSLLPFLKLHSISVIMMTEQQRLCAVQLLGQYNSRNTILKS